MCYNSLNYSLWFVDTDTDIQKKETTMKLKMNTMLSIKVTNKGRIQGVL